MERLRKHLRQVFIMGTQHRRGQMQRKTMNGVELHRLGANSRRNSKRKRSICAAVERNEYTVEYLPGGHGTFEREREHQGLHYGDATPEGPDAVNNHEAGWSFAGWSPSWEASVTGNAVYIATWNRNEYTVTYQPGEHGTFEEQSTSGPHYGDATPEAPDAKEEIMRMAGVLQAGVRR